MIIACNDQQHGGEQYMSKEDDVFNRIFLSLQLHI